MQENQYFTPSIEDIRVGYECEMFDDRLQDPENINWINVVLDDWDQVGYAIEDIKWRVRVPYLTKEQIEAEGWEFVDIYRDGGTSVFYKLGERKNSYELIVGRTNMMTPSSNIIINKTERDGNIFRKNLIYNGDAPSINEFRKICKLLNIR